MTIPNVTPYGGQKPIPGQDQPTFNQNMSDELDYFNALPAELNTAIDAMNHTANDVDDAKTAAEAAASEADISANAAAASGNYQGDFTPGVTSATAGESYSFNGSTWLCLANTTTDPSVENANWRKVVSLDDVSAAEERLLGPGAKIYRGSNGQYVENGNVVPSENPPYTHLAVPINGKAEDVAISPLASGVVTALTETGATIGGTPVEFTPWFLDALSGETFTKTIESMSEVVGVERFKLPASTISEAVTKSITDGQKILGTDTILTRLEFPDGVNGLFYDASTDEPNNGEVSHMALINLGGKDSVNDSSGIYFDSLAGNNPQRNDHHHLAIEGWGYAGVRYSGGWGNVLRQSRLVGNDNGIKFDTSFEPGWSGSGQLTYCNYIAGNNVGYYNVNGWANTSINDVIQSNSNEGIINAGNNQVFISTWLEDNNSQPLFTRGGVIIGGRGWTFRTTLDDDLTVADEAIVRSDQLGISVFRDQSNPMINVGGRGVTQANNILPSTPMRQRNFQRTQSASYATVWEVCSTNNYFDHSNDQLAANQLDDNFKTASIRIEGNGASANSGTGNAKVIFSTGTYKRDGTTTATDYRDQWEISFDGNLDPVNDADTDIGDGTHRVNNLYLVNNPVVGSDANIKRDRRSIPQELCDFALSVENECYKLAVNESDRDHFGIVIDEKFLTEISKVVNIDEFAPLCKEVFSDESGNPIEAHLWGKKERVELDFDEQNLELYCDIEKESCNVWIDGVVSGGAGRYTFDIFEINETQQDPVLPVVVVEHGGIRLGELWQVRYAEWGIIVAEAQRRLLKKHEEEIENIKAHLGI